VLVHSRQQATILLAASQTKMPEVADPATAQVEAVWLAAAEQTAMVLRVGAQEHAKAWFRAAAEDNPLRLATQIPTWPVKAV